MFELPVKEVHSIVSRMIIKEELLVRLSNCMQFAECDYVCAGLTG